VAVDPQLDVYGQSSSSPAVETRTYATERLELSKDLKCTFNFKTGSKGLSGSVKVHNLSQSSRDYPFDGPLGLKGTTLILDAGYEDNHDQILRCGIADINEYKDGADLVTEYILGSPNTWFSRGDGSISYDQPKTLYQIIIDALERNGVEYEDGLIEAIEAGETSEFLRPRDDFIFVGSLRELLDELIWHIWRIERNVPQLFDPPVRPNGKKEPPRWIVGNKLHKAAYYQDQLGKVHLHWEDIPKKLRDIVSITPETGLIGVPVTKSNKSDKKLRVKHMLIPQLRKHALVRIKTDGNYTRLKDSDYTISSIEYSGSNYNGRHEVMMELGRAKING
jgi:hypothetical protein